jgi:hypothetical protein
MNTQIIRQQLQGNNKCRALTLTRVQLNDEITLTALLLLVAIAFCFATNSSAQQTIGTASNGGSAVTPVASRILIATSLGSSLDSKKLKVGDEIFFRTNASLSLRNGMMIPRGTKVIGHITEAKAKSKGDPQSSLAILFDKFGFPDGKTMDVHGVIQAVGPDLSAAYPSGGGVGYTDLQQATYSPSVSIAPRTVPVLNEQSVGVVGIKNLQLSSEGVLSSDSKSVKLESGFQVLLQVHLGGGE